MSILNELQILNLYNDVQDGNIEEFSQNVKSTLNVKIDYDKTENDVDDFYDKFLIANDEEFDD